MKLSTSNTYDITPIANTQTYQEIPDFFDFFNSFTTDIVTGFNNQLTLADNFNYIESTLNVKHGIPINIGNVSIVTTFIRSESSVLTYKITTNNDSSKNLTVYFKESQNVLAKAAIWVAGTIVRYTIQNISAYNVGDVVIISNFGTASNNGTFLVTEIDNTNNYIYVINRKRTSATEDESRTGYVGDDLTKVSIVLGVLSK